MKTYYLTLSVAFPVTHARAGKPTEFRQSFANAQMCAKCQSEPKGMCMGECIVGRKKVHTIRGNFPLWEKRFEEIERGEACLAVKQWTGRPYRSTMVEIARLTREDGIGLQQLRFTVDADNSRVAIIDGVCLPSLRVLADNDGLSFDDWNEWFRGSQCSQPMAIIHFTKFRY